MSDPTIQSLGHRALFLHAWDLAEDGPDSVMEQIAAANLNTMCLAGTYHSGWFIHPRSAHRAFMTEGSACYFQPDLSLYRDTPLRPAVSKLCQEMDWFSEAGRRLGQHGLRLVCWTIGTHNTRLGLAHPELTQTNAYGDCLPHALCPSQPAVRNYLLALCRDIATRYPVWALQLESFGWLSISHNHHHERDLVELTPLEKQLMSLCFCPACTQAASQAGVDVISLRSVVRGILDDAFRHAPNRPPHHPLSMQEIESSYPTLTKFNLWRAGMARSVIRDIRQVALKGTDCRILLQTPFDAELAEIVDGFACSAYGQDALATAQTCRTATRHTPASWPGLIQCFIRLGMNVPQSREELADIIAAVSTNGCNGIGFYNRSESPPQMLDWMSEVMNNHRGVVA